MPRPPAEHPTPAELEVLKILWGHGPMTVREVLNVLSEKRGPRAYTSVMSLLNVMTEKQLLTRSPQGRAYLYEARVPRDKTLGQMVGDLWQRVFEGSASTLVTHVLEQANPTAEELEAVRRLIEQHEQDKQKERPEK